MSWHDDPLWTPEPIVGYRGWTWNDSYLIGPNGIPWTGRFMEAEHTGAYGGVVPHKSPNPGCLCGINAYKESYRARRYNIMGKLHLTGIVDEYEEGYRAQFGEIIEIAVFCKYLSTLPPNVLTDRIATSGPFPKEKIDERIEEIYQVPVTRVKRIPWREQNLKATRKEQRGGRDRRPSAPDHLRA